MAISIQIKRGSEAKVKAATLKAGELAFATDTKHLFSGVDGQAGTAVQIAAGSADTADKLATARNISATGDVTATAVSFDGSADVALATTIANGAVTKAKTDAGVQASLALADTSVQSVGAGNGISIGGTATAPTVAIKVDPASTANVVSTSADGLKITVPAAAEYAIVKAAVATTGMASTYKLQKDGVDVTGSVIDIPKDYLVKSAELKTATGADASGFPAGTKYIDFVINSVDATGTESHIYLNVADLVDAYTSGSATDDPVVVAVSADNKITATLTDGKITLAKLAADVQTSLGKADTAVQPADITTGTTNGTIKIGATEVKVAGLGDAAYKSTGTAAGEIPVLNVDGKLPGDLVPDISDKYIEVAEKAAASGVATLGADSKIPVDQLPTASASSLGAVKSGSNVLVATDGTMSIGDIDCGEIA